MGKRVMIVDDSLVARAMLRDMLVAGGHEVVAEAISGEEAVTQYKNLAPDVVIMDIVLPNKNGIAAADEILSMDRKAKIIIISVLDDIPLIQAAFTVGAIDFIHKPFKLEKILEAIQNI